MSREFDHDTFGSNVRESKIFPILNISERLHEHASIRTENTNLSHNLRVPFASDGRHDTLSTDRRENPLCEIRPPKASSYTNSNYTMRAPCVSDGQNDISFIDRRGNPLYEIRPPYKRVSLHNNVDTNLSYNEPRAPWLGDGQYGNTSIDREGCPVYENHPLNKRASLFNEFDDKVNKMHTLHSRQKYHDNDPWFAEKDQQISTTFNRRIVFPLGLNDAIRTIPIFEGVADMLPVFTRSIYKVRSAFGPESEHALILKLKGPASDGLASRLTRYKNIDELLRDLKTQYWGHEGADYMKRRLQTIEPGQSESTAIFGLRVQSLHNSLMNALEQDLDIAESDRELLKEIEIK